MQARMGGRVTDRLHARLRAVGARRAGAARGDAHAAARRRPASLTCPPLSPEPPSQLGSRYYLIQRNWANRSPSGYCSLT